MSTDVEKPYQDMVLINLYDRFPDEQACWNYFLSLKWPNGFICPACSSTRGCFKPSRQLFECYSCRHQANLIAVRDALYELHGLIEADEIFIGGKQTLAERRQHGNNKAPFFMAVQEYEKGGPTFVTCEEIEGIYESQMLPAIEKHISKGSKMISDGEGSYVGCPAKGYEHDRYVESQDPDLAHEKLQWINMLTSNLKRPFQ